MALTLPAITENVFNIIVVIIIVFGAFFLIGLTTNLFRNWLMKKARTKKQRSNIGIFSKVLKYTLIIGILFAVLFSKGSLDGFGVWLGLLSAGLGLALQRPITGIAAWLIVIIKRPFEIGDRVIIGNVKGDVADISLTHIYLKEIGGLIASEESSGRMIIIPNSVLFEQNIVNYTLTDEFVLHEVVTSVTYESDLSQAEKIILAAAEKETEQFAKKTGKKPYIRTFFQPSGINVHVRYFTPADMLQETSSNVTKAIYNAIMKDSKVEIAYPHTELIFKNKKSVKG